MSKKFTPPMDPKFHSIFYRRSVRQYKPEPLTDEEVQIIIQGAMRAPTAGNMMMYTILEVKDQAKKDRLVKTCDNQPFIAKAPLVLIFLADMQRLFDYYTYCGVSEKCTARNIEYRTPKEADMMLSSCDALIAAQNAVTTAETLGIGSCYIGDIMENLEEHRAMFSLPKWVFPITMVCFGYSKSTVPPEERRLIPRFPQHTIHYQDFYQHLGVSDFKEMYGKSEEQSKNMIENNPDIDNVGQLLYFRKTGADFTKEMERSVKLAIKDWIA
ncbi:MAG: nitroreductase family protein [Promethearchaeota archaeon]